MGIKENVANGRPKDFSESLSVHMNHVSTTLFLQAVPKNSPYNFPRSPLNLALSLQRCRHHGFDTQGLQARRWFGRSETRVVAQEVPTMSGYVSHRSHQEVHKK